jgi:hypothetical protein
MDLLRMFHGSYDAYGLDIYLFNLKEEHRHESAMSAPLKQYLRLIQGSRSSLGPLSTGPDPDFIYLSPPEFAEGSRLPIDRSRENRRTPSV